uniref:Arginine-hydroxylase NDUFAF5, mitochondrial n=1 Tax=Triatoma infestans TaxID=30076 RepID=A0A023F7U5_TRIIF
MFYHLSKRVLQYNACHELYKYEQRTLLKNQWPNFAYIAVLRLVHQETVMNVFDRRAKLLQKTRASNLDNVELYDYLKDEVGYRLTDRIFDIKRSFHKVIDLGCGRGSASKNVLSDCVENLIMCDMSESMLEKAVLPEESVKVSKIVVDEEDLPFEENSMDMVMSNLSLHWVNNLPGTFAQVLKCLKNDGVFLGSVFGGDTLFELRASLQLAETERAGGISPHISPFTDVRDIGGLLNQAGFTMLTIDCDEIIVKYPSMFELMWDLKGMAENNCTWARSHHLRKEVMIAASAIYKEMYGTDEHIPATFQILYFVAWKPDPSQPKPAKRGSATHSLDSLGEIITGKEKVP